MVGDEAINQKGVLFAVRGIQHADRFAVSLYSLRQHFAGPVLVVAEGDFPPALLTLCKRLNAEVTLQPVSTLPVYTAKTAALALTPFEETLFLDADIAVLSGVEELFAMLGEHDFVFTRFGSWNNAGDRGYRVLEQWESEGLASAALIQKARTFPGINTGVFVYRKGHPFLSQWWSLTWKAEEAGLNIPDEVCAQIHLPELKHVIAPFEWNYSAMMGIMPAAPARILHFHGGSHEGNFPHVALFNRLLEEVAGVHPDLFGQTARKEVTATIPGQKPDLLFTCAFDGGSGPEVYRAQAKMLVSSVLRTGFAGEITVFRNSERPLFMVPRQGLSEVYLPINLGRGVTGEERREFATWFKFRAEEYLDVERYNRILYVDSDCLAMNNPASLFGLDAEIGYTEEYGIPLTAPHFRGHLHSRDVTGKTGSNAGVWWIKGEHFRAVAGAVRGIAATPVDEPAFWGDQPAWNRFLQETELRSSPFPRELFKFPAYLDRDVLECREATMLHFCGPGMTEARKLEMMFGMFMLRFYGDAAPVMMDVLEI